MADINRIAFLAGQMNIHFGFNFNCFGPAMKNTRPFHRCDTSWPQALNPKNFQPKQLIIVETELWPNLIRTVSHNDT